MIYIFTGNGKGKTTAAIGQAIRAFGQGKRVLIVQFIKSKKIPSGEDKIISKLGKRFQLVKGGKGFVKILGDKLPFKKHKIAAENTLKIAKKAIFSDKFDLIVLDEINVALNLNLISENKVISLLKKIPENLDLILTGRGAKKELIKIADLVTEFKEVKHPFRKGILGKRGREF